MRTAAQVEEMRESYFVGGKRRPRGVRGDHPIYRAIYNTLHWVQHETMPDSRFDELIAERFVEYDADIEQALVTDPPKRPLIERQLTYAINPTQVTTVRTVVELIARLDGPLDIGCETLHNDERGVDNWRGYYAIRTGVNTWVDGPYLSLGDLATDQEQQDVTGGDGRRLTDVVRID